MRILLDTQIWLWMQASPDRLSERCLALVSDEANEILLSAASAWEIAIKYALGKLPLPEPPKDYVPDRMVSGGVSGLPVEVSHAIEVAQLPPHHRDPFDRLLVAQARAEGISLMTADPRLEPYDVDLLRAT